VESVQVYPSQEASLSGMRTALAFQLLMALQLGDCPPQGSEGAHPCAATNSSALAFTPRSCRVLPEPSTRWLPETFTTSAEEPVETDEELLELLLEALLEDEELLELLELLEDEELLEMETPEVLPVEAVKLLETVKVDPLKPQWLPLPTAMSPVLASFGTVTLTDVLLTFVMPPSCALPTHAAVMEDSPFPLNVTTVPAGPLVGEIEAM
jgi:hypothetical protein